jgi:ABC-type spermidine/putrescine transport system permease subunit II
VKLYERRHEALASRERFVQRLIRSISVGTVFVIASLAIGMCGFHFTEQLAWLDAFVNAAMLLSGMGPLHAPATDGGKIFAGLYSIYCGFAVLIGAAIIFAPIIHRAMHHFHLDNDEKDDEPGARKRR